MGLSRRKFISLAAGTTVAAAIGYPTLLEPNWLTVRHLSVGNGLRKIRAVHFSDFHYKGDDSMAQRLIKLINAQSPEIVFFSGDFVEKKHFAQRAIQFIQQIKAPVYGCPGNHDLVSGVPFIDLQKGFAATGGNWLSDSTRWTTTHGLTISTVNWWENPPPVAPPAGFRVLLCHYPAFVDKLAPGAFDLILSGHSHGGQIRLPFYGALVLPYGVGRYELGEYQTPAGLLNVTSGIGWYHVPCRLLCHPEIVTLDIFLPV